MPSSKKETIRGIFNESPSMSEARLLEVMAELMGDTSVEILGSMLQDADCSCGDGSVDIDKFLDWIFSGEPDSPLAVLPPLPLLREISGPTGHEKLVLGSNSIAPGFLKRERSVPAQPLLMRGKTGHDRNDMLGLANLVADALDKCGWAGVGRDEIAVVDASGHGGSKTFKVSAPDRFAVALHSRAEEMTSDKVSEPRTESAAATLAQHGCAPGRLAYGGDWFIERWEGKPLGPAIFLQLLEEPLEILALVPEDSPNKCIFEHAADLKSKAVPMTLSSHPGKAVCIVGGLVPALTEHSDRNDLYRLAIGDAKDAVTLKCDGTDNLFLTNPDTDTTLDIDCWRVDKEGCHLWLLTEVSDDKNVPGKDIRSRDEQEGREFIVNEDGSIGVKNSTSGMVLGMKEPFAATSFQELASLLARIHKIPTDWFDQWREKLCEMYPALKVASQGSVLWWYTTRQGTVKDFSEEAMAGWLRAEPRPFTKAGSRIVTNHGDFHSGNIIRTSDGLKGIDLEGACVAYAVNDLAWAFCVWCTERGQRRALAKAYLEAMDDASGPEDVDLFLLDIETFRLGIVFGNDNLFGEAQQLKEDVTSGCPVTASLCAISAEAREDAALRAEILEKGLRKCARGVEVIKKDKEYKGNYSPDVPVTLATARDQPSQIFAICKDGTLLANRAQHKAEHLAVGAKSDGTAILVRGCSTDCLKFDTSKVASSDLFDHLPPAHFALGDKFLVRLNAGSSLSWEKCDEFAKTSGGVLPTLKQFQEAGVQDRDGLDVWMPALTEAGEQEWVQISKGCHPLWKVHSDFGAPGWGKHDEPEQWRRSFLYVVLPEKKEAEDTPSLEPGVEPGPFPLVLANDPSKGLVVLEESGGSFALGLGPSEKAICVMVTGKYLRHNGKGINIGHLSL